MRAEGAPEPRITRVPLPLCFAPASTLIPTQTTLAASLGMLPFFPHQLTAGQAGPGRGTTQEKQSASASINEASFSGSQQYLQTFPGLPTGGTLTGHQKTQQSPAKGPEVGSRARNLFVPELWHCSATCVVVVSTASFPHLSSSSRLTFWSCCEFVKS